MDLLNVHLAVLECGKEMVTVMTPAMLVLATLMVVIAVARRPQLHLRAHQLQA